MKRNILFVLAALFCLTRVAAMAADVLPLAGQWRFEIDRKDVGLTQNWFDKDLPDTIHLPGILESQGYGNPISIHTPWVLSLYDHYWYLREAYKPYTKPGHVKVPFLCQPTRHYIGAAWYQRDVEVPADWKGKHLVLFMERPHWKSTVWLDNRKVGSDISLCAPHVYDLGVVAPGRHRLTVRVDNSMILPYRPDAHSISDSLDDAWNGIVGKIQLRATPPVWVDDVQVFPNEKTKRIHVRLTLHNITGKTADGTVSFSLKAAPGTPKLHLSLGSQSFESGKTTEVLNEDFDVGSQAKAWDEFSPNLYKISIETKAAVSGTNYASKAGAEFGFRNLTTNGTRFILNGHPIYFRGTHFGGDFPLTGYPATDVASWKKIIQTCKDYGLNHIRFHSWCPPEAAFQAADELGFYFQVECGMWNTFSPGSPMVKMLYSETDKIIRHFGNHPSLMLLSASNEAHGHWTEVLPEWVKHYRSEDPRRLYTPDTGWSLIERPTQPLTGGADYLDVGRIGPHRVRGESGWFGGDFRSSIAGVKVPVIAHEVGQWCAYPNYDIIKKFTGFMHPGNFEIFRDSAAAHGVLADDAKFAWASGRFQLECYKEEVEANLRTPGLDGFQLLDLHDYTGQGTALVGLLDPFWQSKGYVTPAEFREFCNTVVPLARLDTRVFTTSESFDVPVEVANYGSGALANATASWQIIDAGGKTITAGSLKSGTIPLGKNFKLGTVSADLAKLPAPAQYKLVVTVSGDGAAGKEFRNDWNFWVYPSKISAKVPDGVTMTRSWTDAEKQLAAGGKVLFMPRNADLNWTCPPLAQVPIFWNALMGPKWSRMLGLWCNVKSSALAEFPTQANCDWQWTELLRDTRAINLDKFPAGLTPIVSAIDDWNRNYKLGVVFQAKVGAGKLLVCSIDLNGIDSPVARQLRRSLLDYMASPAFEPKTAITDADLESVHFDTRIMDQLGAAATADGSPASAIVDGDPNTFWSSADRRGNTTPHPHVIEVSFPRPVAMTGLVLMPRQNQRQHEGDIKDYTLEGSADGVHWQTIKRGQLPSTFHPLKIPFGKTVTVKNLKLTALSGFGSDKAAALADLAVIYAGPKLAEQGGEMHYKNVRTASPDIDAGDSGGLPQRKQK